MYALCLEMLSTFSKPFLHGWFQKAREQLTLVLLISAHESLNLLIRKTSFQSHIHIPFSLGLSFTTNSLAHATTLIHSQVFQSTMFSYKPLQVFKYQESLNIWICFSYCLLSGAYNSAFITFFEMWRMTFLSKSVAHDININAAY